MAVRFVALALLALCVAHTTAEVVEYVPCEGVSTEHCTIHEVRVEPCKEAPGSCKLKLGKSASVSFDYTLHFDAATLKNSVHSELSGQDVKLDSLAEDACGNTVCPASRDRRATYSYSLPILRTWPQGSFPTTWRLWNPANEAQTCCAVIEIYLKR